LANKQFYHIDNFMAGKIYTKTPCTVDTDNMFTYKGVQYIIDKKLKQYEVKNKAKRFSNGQLNDFTNEAEMDTIFAVESVEDGLIFFDQDDYLIRKELIKQV
jgi:hypothetical protein